MSKDVNTILNIASLGLKAVSFIGQRNAAKEEASLKRESLQAQVRASNVNQRIAEIRNIREIRDNVRKARIARAQVLNAGAVRGVGTSSSVIGGAGAVQAQLASNIGFLNTQQDLNRQANAYLDQSAEFQNQAISAGDRGNVFRGIGGFASGVFTDTGGYNTIFKDRTPAPGAES